MLPRVNTRIIERKIMSTVWTEAVVEAALQVDEPEQHTHPIIFESITGPLIRTAALHRGECALPCVYPLTICQAETSQDNYLSTEVIAHSRGNSEDA